MSRPDHLYGRWSGDGKMVEGKGAEDQEVIAKFIHDSFEIVLLRGY